MFVPKGLVFLFLALFKILRFFSGHGGYDHFCKLLISLERQIKSFDLVIVISKGYFQSFIGFFHITAVFILKKLQDFFNSIFAVVKAAIQAAYEEGASKLKGSGKSVPSLKAIKTPLRDGDLERPDDEAYANNYFINANSTSAPGIVDADRQPIIDHSEVYSGVYGRASINFYAFNSNGNKGIACGLNNLQKIKDGEPLGGKSRAEDDFDDEDDDLLD